MHELSLAHGLLRLVTEAARPHQGATVTQIRVRVGPLAHVDPKALTWAFEAASVGSLAAGATLIYDRSAAEARCFSCDHVFAPDARGEPCPKCGGYQWLLLEGEEMEVIDVEINL